MRGVEMGGPDSDIARMKKGKKGPFIAVAVIVALGALGAGGYALYGKLAPKPSPSKAYGALWGCMVGPPLDEGESLESRFRSITAALGDAKGDWPKRCEDELTAFYQTLGSDPKSSGVKEVMDLELKCTTQCSADSLVGKLGQLHDVVTSAGIKPEGAADVKDVPARLAGKPLKADAFKDIVPGTAALQGMTKLGADKTALLYRDQVGTLYGCEIDPDGDRPIRCGPLTLPIKKPAAARLVENKSKLLIVGVTEMGNSVEETKRGVFDAWTGQQTDDVPEDVVAASDRPRLPASEGVWVDAELEGTKVKLARAPNGVLRLDRGSDPPRFVMDDSDHDGPGTGDPIAFVGKKRAVILFRAKHGVAALFVSGSGETKPGE